MSFRHGIGFRGDPEEEKLDMRLTSGLKPYRRLRFFPTEKLATMKRTP